MKTPTPRDKKRKRDLRFYYNHRERLLKESAEYYQLNKKEINQKTINRLRKQKDTKLGRDKYNAYQWLVYNIKVGKIYKLPCEVCGLPEVQAHHYRGYDNKNRKFIRWLCLKHHTEAHFGLIPERKKRLEK